MCCGSEATLARAILEPLEDVLDVKISVTERRAAIEHRARLPAAEIVRVLNEKHLGASIAEVGGAAADDRGSGALSSSDLLRASTTVGQITLFGLALALRLAGALPLLSRTAAYASILLSWPMLRHAYAALRRCSPNVELLMAVATGGSLLLGDYLEAASVGAMVSLMDAVKLLAIERFDRAHAETLTLTLP
jgi:Cd2+/Zn2+-exporting ATPase